MKTYKNKCNIKKTELFEILDKQAFAIAKVNPLGEYLYFNKKESFLREFDKNKYSPLNIFNFYNNQDCITLKKIFAQCLKSENKEFFFEYENKSNFFKMRLIKDIDGNILISTNNISKEKESERILEENKENIKRLNDAVNGANIGCWDFFPQEGKIIANKTWVSQKKYKDQDFRENNELFSNIIDGLDKWATLVHPEDLENTKKIIQKHLEGKTDIYQAEFRMKCGDNKYRWIRDLGKVFLRDKNGNPIRMNGVHIDITESKNLELEIKKLSITGGLTGLLNRRYFEKYFNKIMFESKRDKKDVSFLMIDIDFFKEYNDTYGHQMGDDALIKISNSLKSLLHRNDDYCFRLGGEEFGIIFKINKKEEAISFANKIKNKIENLKIEHKKSKISNYLTISLGLYCNKPKEIKNLDYIYKEADSLLYKAKEKGRNTLITN